jgi:hypothetical protein
MESNENASESYFCCSVLVLKNSAGRVSDPILPEVSSTTTILIELALLSLGTNCSKGMPFLSSSCRLAGFTAKLSVCSVTRAACTESFRSKRKISNLSFHRSPSFTKSTSEVAIFSLSAVPLVARWPDGSGLSTWTVPSHRDIRCGSATKSRAVSRLSPRAGDTDRPRVCRG